MFLEDAQFLSGSSNSNASRRCFILLAVSESVQNASRGGSRHVQQVDLIRLRRHNEVVAVKTLYPPRPPRDSYSAPLRQQRRMVALLLADFADLNGERQRSFEVPESEGPFKSLRPVPLYHRPFWELPVEFSNLGFSESGLASAERRATFLRKLQQHVAVSILRNGIFRVSRDNSLITIVTLWMYESRRTTAKTIKVSVKPCIV